jgi:hypothetical protein
VLQLDGEDFASCYVVTVREAAGDRHNLVLQQEFRILAQPMDVQAIDGAASLFKRELRFHVAVGARGSQDQNAWRGHGFSREFPRFARPSAAANRYQTAFDGRLAGHYRCRHFAVIVRKKGGDSI